MKYYKSNAQWSEGMMDGFDNDISTDKHGTESMAQCVCRALEREGFGGEGKVFPIRTWVSPVGVYKYEPIKNRVEI